jgi:hypothetical protein
VVVAGQMTVRPGGKVGVGSAASAANGTSSEKQGS